MTQIPTGTALQAGMMAPDFTLPREDGSAVTLSAFRPGKVVLYFYPKDSTPACTTEALDFTRLADDFAAAGTTVIGLSKDSIRRHANFCAKNGLKVILVSDEQGTVCEDFGVWGEKQMYGKTYMGIRRTTFLIGADGRIAQVWPAVSVKDHAEAVLAAARAL